MRTVIAFIFILVFLGCNHSEQNIPTNDSVKTKSIKYPLPKNPDSLFRLLKTVQEDTNKVNILTDLAWELKGNNTDTSIIISLSALTLSEKLNWKIGSANSLGYLGVFENLKGDNSKALDYLQQALKIAEAVGDKKAIGRHLGNIANSYLALGDYTKSLDYYFKALKIAEELKDKRGMATRLGNIGLIYSQTKDYPKALDYCSRALKIDEELGNKTGIARHLTNIGIIYNYEINFSKALEFHFRALKMKEELHDKSALAIQYCNIGNVYNDSGLYSMASDYYLRALKLAQELNRKHSIATNLVNLGTVNAKLRKFMIAKEYLFKAKTLYEEMGEKQGIKECEKNLSDLYYDTGKFKEALESYKIYVQYQDSLANESNTKKQTQLEMQYEFDKKSAADSIRTSEMKKQDDLKHDQEIKQQQIYTLGGGIGFLLMLIVAIMSFRAFKQKQKANEIIAHQKLLVEEKQKEILDSIHYAKRIQQSLLPTEKYILKNLDRLNKKQ